jgi:hypothetical protein
MSTGAAKLFGGANGGGRRRFAGSGAPGPPPSLTSPLVASGGTLMTETTPPLQNGREADQRKPRPLFSYFFFTGLGALVSAAAAVAFGSGRLDKLNVGVLLLWFPAAVAGVVCAAQICRLGCSPAQRVLGGLFLAGHCLSLALLVLVGAMLLWLQLT